MVTEAQRKARQNFVNRFAYGLGRGVARYKHEKGRTLKIGREGRAKVKSQEYKHLRGGIAFLVGVKQGVSRRKKEQIANAKRAAARAAKKK